MLTFLFFLHKIERTDMKNLLKNIGSLPQEEKNWLLKKIKLLKLLDYNNLKDCEQFLEVIERIAFHKGYISICVLLTDLDCDTKDDQYQIINTLSLAN